MIPPRIQRMLDLQVQFYNATETLTEDAMITDCNYPYLSSEQRSAYLMTPLSLLDSILKDGDCVHFPWTPHEFGACSRVFKQLGAYNEKALLQPSFIKQLEAVTIGRSRESIKSWLQDCMHDAIEDNLGCHIILHKKQAAQTWSTVRPLSGIACFLQERISGQVTTASDKDLAWILRHCPSLSYRKVTDRVMNSGPFTCLRAFKGGFIAGSVAFTDSQFNRAGEVSICRLTGPCPSLRTWDAHTNLTPEGDIFHNSVLDIAVCTHSRHFFTASTDGCIKVWTLDQASHCATWKSMSKMGVNNLALHSSELILASASKDGSVHLWPFDFVAPRSDAKRYKVKKPSLLFRRQPQDAYNIVDSLFFAGTSYPNLLAAMTCFDVLKKRGSVALYDGLSMSPLSEISDINLPITDAAASSSGHLFAVGTGSYVDGMTGDGILRVYETSNLMALKPLPSHLVSRPAYYPSRPVQCFKSAHINVDSVHFSPGYDPKFCISCDLDTNDIAIFDRKKPSGPMFLTSHRNYARPSTSESFIATSWISEDLLLTGGEDCVVRLWDLRASASSSSDKNLSAFNRRKSTTTTNCTLVDKMPRLLNEWELDQPINCIALQPDGSTFAVGTEIGGFHLFSIDNLLISSEFSYIFN